MIVTYLDSDILYIFILLSCMLSLYIKANILITTLGQIYILFNKTILRLYLNLYLVFQLSALRWHFQKIYLSKPFTTKCLFSNYLLYNNFLFLLKFL